jgi:hypothetical protein
LGLVANRLSGGVSENPTVANDLSDSISDDLKED